jgi:hypothetical protein
MFNNNVGEPLCWDRILEDDLEELDEIDERIIIVVKSKECLKRFKK